MLLRSCDSWTNTCLTAWEQRRESSRSKARRAPLTLTLSSGSARVAGSASMGRGADGVGGTASAGGDVRGRPRASPRGRRRPSAVHEAQCEARYTRTQILNLSSP